MDAWDKPEAKDKPNVAKDRKKWSRARAAATRKFGAKNSYVKNMWATRKYNQSGGKWKKSLVEEDSGSGNIDWEKVLNEYGKYRVAYKENLLALKELNPYVFVWSETDHMPMPNATVDPNDLEKWNEATQKLQGAAAQVIRFEKTFNGLRTPGNMVTAETLARSAPAGVTSQTLALALGVTEQDHKQAWENFSLLMAKRIYESRFGKSMPWDDMEPLRKDAPFAGEHHSGEVDEESGEDEGSAGGTGEKSGMVLRWDGAHRYSVPVVVNATFGDLSKQDKFAVRLAHKLAEDPEKTAQLQHAIRTNARLDWVIFPWLRPAQERHFNQGVFQYMAHYLNAASNVNHRWGAAAKGRALQRARDHVAKIQTERKMIVRGELKHLKLAERYKHDRVQAGTIAANNIKERIETGKTTGHHAQNQVDVGEGSKQLIPLQGQHGPTAYDQHENEHFMQNVPRAHPGRTGGQWLSATHSLSGVDMPELFHAMKLAGVMRRQPQFRGVPARQAIRLNVGLPTVSRKEWKDWQSWNQHQGETTSAFFDRKFAEFEALETLGVKRDAQGNPIGGGGRPNPSNWRTVFAQFMNGQILAANPNNPNGPPIQITVTPQMRQDVYKAAARQAVNRGVIRTEQEFQSLTARQRHRYLRLVMHEMHKNAHPELYGEERERRFAAARLREGRRGGERPDITPRGAQQFAMREPAAARPSGRQEVPLSTGRAGDVRRQPGQPRGARGRTESGRPIPRNRGRLWAPFTPNADQPGSGAARTTSFPGQRNSTRNRQRRMVPGPQNAPVGSPARRARPLNPRPPAPPRQPRQPRQPRPNRLNSWRTASWVANTPQEKIDELNRIEAYIQRLSGRIATGTPEQGRPVADLDNAKRAWVTANKRFLNVMTNPNATEQRKQAAIQSYQTAMNAAATFFGRQFITQVGNGIRQRAEAGQRTPQQDFTPQTRQDRTGATVASDFGKLSARKRAIGRQRQKLSGKIRALEQSMYLLNRGLVKAQLADWMENQQVAR